MGRAVGSVRAEEQELVLGRHLTRVSADVLADVVPSVAGSGGTWPPGFQLPHRTQGLQGLTLRVSVQRDHSPASPTGKLRTQTDHKAPGPDSRLLSLLWCMELRPAPVRSERF